MSPGSLLFLICSFACLAGALGTILAKNPVRGAVGLLTTIIGIAGLFLKLAAQFIAAIQLIVYAGAVVVLFVFVIMLLGPDAGTAPASKHARLAKLLSGVLMLAMAAGLVAVLAPHAASATRLGPVAADHGSVEAVGRLMFTDGIVPFEITTVLLTVAIVGAIAVARGKQGIRRKKPLVEKPTDLFVGPLHPRDAGRPLDER